MIRTLSQTESARRSTVFTRATDDELDALGEYYGLVRPSAYPVSAWREVLRAVVYRPRGTVGSLFSALNALFKPWTDTTAITTTINADGEFTHASLTSKAYAHRWVRVGGDSYQWVDEVDTATTTATLNTVRSSYWDAWSAERQNVEVAFLPFYFVESDARIRVYIDLDLLSVPPTYIQESGATRPNGQPYGGQLLNLLDLDPNTLDYGDQVNGPYPLYLRGDEASGVLGDLLNRIIVAGVKVDVVGVSFNGSLGYPSISDL